MPKRARHDLPAVQERRAEVVRYRAEGRTWDEIARLTGFSNGSAASKAWRAAIQQRPDLTVDEVRAQEKTRLEAMDSVLSSVVSDPPVKVTAIGKTQYDDQGRPVKDMSVVIAAVRERRQIGESLRRLTGADATRPVMPEDQARAQMTADLDRHRAAIGPGLIIPPGVVAGGQRAISAWVGTRLYYAQRDQAAIPAAPPEPEVVDAEIVPDE